MLYVIGADFHAGASLRKYGDVELDADFDKALVSIVAECKKLKKPFTLIIAGDIYDKSVIDGMTKKAFDNFMKEIGELTPHKVIFIQGNHDRQHVKRDVPFMSSYNNAIHASACNNSGVDGFDYMPTLAIKAKFDEIRNKNQFFDILVTHCSFDSVAGFESNYSASLEEIPSNIRLVVAGHIHTSKCIPRSCDKGVGYWLSPGPIMHNKIDEKGPFGVWVWDSEEPECQPIFKAIPTRTVIPVTLTMESKLESILLNLEMICNNNKTKPIVHLIHYSDRLIDIVTIEEKLKDKAIIIKTSRPKLVESDNSITLNDRSALSLQDAIDALVDKNKKAEVYTLAQQLLSSEDPKSTIETFVKERLK